MVHGDIRELYLLRLPDPFMPNIHDLSLTHYSEEPWGGPLRSVEQLTVPHFKPAGLWFSVDGKHDWPAWCEREAWCLEALTHTARIVLASDAQILWLSTAG